MGKPTGRAGAGPAGAGPAGARPAGAGPGMIGGVAVCAADLIDVVGALVEDPAELARPNDTTRGVVREGGLVTVPSLLLWAATVRP